ncbi:MAG: transporter substrate-binding domain-containing protein [Rhodoferax sp.]|uniref:substrate-binding periplasmic protein n=1 Tax=Rhodoferax sp. TaxID=50421 RepID=UPI0032679681
MNTYWKHCFSLAIVAFGIAGECAPWVLRAAAQEGSAPKFIVSNGAATGHCPDILHAIELADKDLRFTIAPSAMPIKRIEKEIRAGTLDIMCALLDSPARNEIALQVSTPVYTVRERLVGLRSDEETIFGFDDLARSGGLVATQTGASYAEKLREHQIKVDETSSAVALQNILRKRVRYFYINELTAIYYIKEEGLEDKLYLLPVIMGRTQSYLWVGRQVDPAVVQKLDAVLAKLKKDGTLDRIYRSYGGTN